MRLLFTFLLAVFIAGAARAQEQPNAATILHKLKKLNFLGSALYVAAHPDDENTRIISWLANGELATTAYLSVTRGDGGQNLIGPEIRDALGLIRTQELIAARKIDGGAQFFGRAIDFGYSKSADETFAIWGREQMLRDVTLIYRKFKPDVVITRFPADERAGHGQHTASAVLAEEAFDAAAGADRFPDQVKDYGTWKPTRLYTNTGRWWNTTINENTPGIITLDVGAYDPLLGTSYTEIAALSRSQHKSQGFGSSGSRGRQLEFLEYVKGDRSAKSLFDGINTSWSRLPGGEKVGRLVDGAIAVFDPLHPAKTVPALLEIRSAIRGLSGSVWRERKLVEVEQLIVDCLGLYCAATTDGYWIAPGDRLSISLEVVKRNPGDVVLTALNSDELNVDSVMRLNLPDDRVTEMALSAVVPATARYSDPYWLKEPHGAGIFTIENEAMIGEPQNAPAASITLSFLVNGQPLRVTRPVIHRWTDAVKGEQQRPVEVVPAVTLRLSQEVMIFNDTATRQVRVRLRSYGGTEIAGSLTLHVPPGWKTAPETVSFALTGKGQEDTKTFSLTPPAGESVGVVKAVATVGGKAYDRSMKSINYDHFPAQILLETAESKIVRLNIQKAGSLVGFIRGAGDEIPAALRNIGYEVWEMGDNEVTAANLARVDAVVLGVRALNTHERIGPIMKTLLGYVERGGTVVVQYNTSHSLLTENFAPYPLQLSRERVTDENSRVKILMPEHPAMNYPNAITDEDFKGWVQERGLYFPNEWDPAYAAVLSMSDGDEDPADGSLLIARHGNGYYVYTGLSFFRELPEGVPGAYKLFANLVSLGKQQGMEPASAKPKKRNRN